MFEESESHPTGNPGVSDSVPSAKVLSQAADPDSGKILSGGPHNENEF
jgi:hypothetical protein